MEDFTAKYLLKIFPELKKIEGPCLLLILDKIIEKFIPLLRKWEVGTDSNMVSPDKFEPININEPFIYVQYVIEGKINNLLIWNRATSGMTGYRHASYKKFLNEKKTVETDCYLPFRARVRFEGEQREYLMNQFSEKIQEFSLKEIIDEIIIEREKEMTDNKAVNPQGEPWMIQMKEFVVTL